MERPIITLPRNLLRPSEFDWDIDWREQSAGVGTGGRRNILMGVLPRWIGSPKINLLDRTSLLTWRAHRWAGRGITGVYRLTMWDPVGHRGGGLPSGNPFSDAVSFSDGTAFENCYQVVTVGYAPAGASEIVIDETGAVAPVRVGQILSHDDWPFGVTSKMPEGQPGLYRLTVEMPLRRAIDDGALIDLAATGLFELVDARSGNPRYGIDRTSRPSLQLQEWLR